MVFLLRSFLVEPFKIPSGSMMPTLLVGDFILVNKYAYGIRLPVANQKILEINQPKNGDVMVFRYPEDPSLDYIKRVVGVPGDKISYRNKQLSINGKPLKIESLGGYSYVKSGLNFVNANLYREQLGGTTTRRWLSLMRLLSAWATCGSFPAAKIALTMTRASAVRCRKATTS